MTERILQETEAKIAHEEVRRSPQQTLPTGPVPNYLTQFLSQHAGLYDSLTAAANLSDVQQQHQTASYDKKPVLGQQLEKRATPGGDQEPVNQSIDLPPLFQQLHQLYQNNGHYGRQMAVAGGFLGIGGGQEVGGDQHQDERSSARAQSSTPTSSGEAANEDSEDAQVDTENI
jgi:hypothetical protein